MFGLESQRFVKSVRVVTRFIGRKLHHPAATRSALINGPAQRAHGEIVQRIGDHQRIATGEFQATLLGRSVVGEPHVVGSEGVIDDNFDT